MPAFPAVFLLSSLDGSNGFEITGVAIGDGSGHSVSAAGDINNDGFGDLIIGAHDADPNGTTSGASYVVFGQSGGFGASVSLSTLNGGNGFKISGEAMFDNSGISVSSAGDINGDGFDDVIVGASGAGLYDAGASYVIFGKAAGFTANLNLSSLNGSNGFRINGEFGGDVTGAAVHAAGDVNGDGFDDIIIGSIGVNRNDYDRDNGAANIIFGKAGGFGAVFNLADINGSNGFNLIGENANDEAGISVSGAGDIDGDGFDDVIIGSGDDRAYVVYGKAGGFSANTNLNNLLGNGGFRLLGNVPFDQIGRSVSGAGDINGDGLDDIIIGAPSDGQQGMVAGAAYVVFGSTTRPTNNVRLDNLDGTRGFKIVGEAAGDFSGASVSAAGDINGDGIQDMIIGAADADPNGSSSGSSYVVFGRAAGFAALVRLGSLNGRNGFEIDGEAASDTSGTSVSAAGDVNGDGFDDLIVGAPGAGGFADTGSSYVIFGYANRALTRTGTEGDDIMSGGEFSDFFEGLGGNDLIRSGAGDDTVLGGAGNDTLDGGDGNDGIQGESGNDRLSGGLGNDLILGGEGNDLIIASAGDDNNQGEGGTDTLSFAGFSAGITIDLASFAFAHPLGEGLQIFGSIENVIGGSGADTITGDEKANRLDGSSGNDVLSGAGGADILIGGAGKDQLTGGGALDTFVFKSVSSSPAGLKRDTIADYTFKEMIDLSAIDANGGLLGNNAFAFIGSAGFSAAGQIRVTQSGADTILQMNTSGTSGAEMEIVLTNYTATAITALDFVL